MLRMSYASVGVCASVWRLWFSALSLAEFLRSAVFGQIPGITVPKIKRSFENPEPLFLRVAFQGSYCLAVINRNFSCSRTHTPHTTTHHIKISAQRHSHLPQKGNSARKLASILKKNTNNSTIHYGSLGILLLFSFECVCVCVSVRDCVTVKLFDISVAIRGGCLGSPCCHHRLPPQQWARAVFVQNRREKKYNQQ